MKRRHVAVVALSVALVFGACGDGGKKQAGPKPGKKTTTTVSDSSESTSADGSATTRGATGTTRKPGTGPATTRIRGSEPGVPDVVAVAPGNYKYTVTGTASVSGTVNGAPLNTAKKIDKKWDVNYFQPKGRTQKATYGGEAPSLEHVLTHSDTSADIAYLRLNNSGKETTFTPNPPARFVPVPATVGATWSWTMTSQPDPKTGKVTTRKGDFRVDRTDVVMIDGKPIPVVVIIGNMTIDQPLMRTIQLTTFYSETHKLIVREREITDGNVDSDKDNTHLQIHTDQTTSINSLVPLGG